MTYLPFKKEDAVRVDILPVKQPIGTFYIGTIKAKDAAGICSAEWRRPGEDVQDELEKYIGIQRPLNKKRVEEIKKYVKTWDATFPNSVILAVRPDYYFMEGESVMYIKRDSQATNIIDGQHRLAGFDTTENLPDDFKLVITLFPDLELEEQAYIFSVINTKMTRINPSLAADLYAFASIDTPEKLTHNIARDFNKDPANPWYDRIKMLGKRESGSTAVLSQSTFTKKIINLISDTTHSYEIRDILKRNKNNRSVLANFHYPNYSQKYIFWDHYIQNKDKFIYLVLKNYFVAVKKTYPADWMDEGKILTKTTGYASLVNVFEKIYRAGFENKDLTETHFSNLFTKAKNSGHVKDLTSIGYNPGSQGEKRLTDDLLKGMEFSS